MSGTYDVTLVTVSFLISVFGSFTGLVLAGQITDLRDGLNRLWLAGAAIALGGGAIWSMHFIGMLAYQMPMPVTYDLTLTLVSMLVAILFTGIGVYLVKRRAEMSYGTLIAAGVVMGLGVASMHYTGMAAMQMAAEMHHDTGIVILSVGIAIVASTAALWIAFTVREAWQKVVSAFVMGVAVCGMHYTAMTGMTFTHAEGNVHLMESTLFTADLARYVIVTTVAVLMVSLFAVFAKTLNDANAID